MDDISPAPTMEVHWVENALWLPLRRRAYGALAVMLFLLLVAEELDALPVDYDLPGVPDVELTYPEYVVVLVALVLGAGFVYASLLLLVNAPRRIGFHRAGLDLEYLSGPDSALRRIHLTTSPTSVRWDDVDHVAPEGDLRLSRHDLTVWPKVGSPELLPGLAPDLLRAVVQAFEAHAGVETEGSWRGFVPVPTRRPKVRFP